MDGLGLPLALFLIAVVTALYAVEDGRPALFRLAKPAATMFLLGIAGVPPRGALGTLVAVGIACCVIGDIALLSEKPTAFLAGLLLFLAAHLCYAGAFFLGPGAPRPSLMFVPLAIFGVASAWLVRTLWANVPADLRVPLCLYAAAITAMVAGVFATLGGGWPLIVGSVGAVGGVLFYLSDANLAWSRYVRTYPHHQTVTLALYWAGQLGVALSVRWAGVLGP